ncbi:MAG TPA: hypothetical protein DCX60_00325 [Phycisphaerales bacterium]|nr:hypothetical protein [Phycisphaerales bacterium]
MPSGWLALLVIGATHTRFGAVRPLRKVIGARRRLFERSIRLMASFSGITTVPATQPGLADPDVKGCVRTSARPDQVQCSQKSEEFGGWIWYT